MRRDRRGDDFARASWLGWLVGGNELRQDFVFGNRKLSGPRGLGSLSCGARSVFFAGKGFDEIALKETFCRSLTRVDGFPRTAWDRLRRPRAVPPIPRPRYETRKG